MFRGGGGAVAIIAASSSSLSSKLLPNWDAYAVVGGTFDAVLGFGVNPKPLPPPGLMNDVARLVPKSPPPDADVATGSVLSAALARRSVDRVTDLGVAFLRHDGA